MTRTTDRELRASRRLISVAEWELQQILLDIHDGPVQYMYAALSQLDLLRRSVEGDGGADVTDRLDRIQRLLEGGLADIRGFIGAFRAPEFQSRDVLSVLESLVVQYETATDLQVSLEVESPIPDVELPIKISLYRVLQEALSNAYRHGGADQVRVRLCVARAAGLAGEHGIRMRVEDNGAGFEPQSVRSDRQFGLQGMQDRMEMVGGAFHLSSTPGEGTVIAVEVPLS